MAEIGRIVAADPEFTQWTTVADSGFPVATFGLLGWTGGLIIARAQIPAQGPTLITNLSEACSKLDQLEIGLAHRNDMTNGGKARMRVEWGEYNKREWWTRSSRSPAAPEYRPA